MMIYPPKISELPTDTLYMSGLGACAGIALKTNPILMAYVLAVSAMANTIFFELANECLRPLLNRAQTEVEITPELTYAVTCLTISSLTYVALNQLEIFSRRLAGVWVILSLAAFAGRLRIIYNG